MGTSKRQRQKEGRLARLEAARIAQQRSQRRRRIVTALILVVVFVGGAFAFSAMFDSDDGQEVTAADTSTTADPTASTEPREFTYGSGECPPEDGADEPKIDFEDAPKLCIDPAASYTAVFETSEGTVRVALDTERTPGTVNNFVTLARWGYYDGTKIFRTDTSIDVIQGGSPHTDDNTDPGPGYTIPDEGGQFTYQPGDLVMARSAAPDSASAQFFFGAGPNVANLDAQGTYVTFGHVTEGLDVLEEILALNEDDPNSGLGGAPSRDVIVESVEIVEEAAPAESSTTSAPASSSSSSTSTTAATGDTTSTTASG
jgi:cyclophilin family peptidyl-prolyl cis-trans isomerase